MSFWLLDYNAPPVWKLPTDPEMVPQKLGGEVSVPICAKKLRIVQPVPTKAFLQPAKTATICTACHKYAHLPPPIPVFILLAQNISSKPIAPTDNMQPKSDNANVDG